MLFFKSVIYLFIFSLQSHASETEDQDVQHEALSVRCIDHTGFDSLTGKKHENIRRFSYYNQHLKKEAAWIAKISNQFAKEGWALASIKDSAYKSNSSSRIIDIVICFDKK